MNAGNGADEARRAIAALCQTIRDVIPPTEFDLSKIGMAEVKEGLLDGRPVQRAILILRSRGCAWALCDGGGCTMCGHLAGTTRGRAVDPDLYVRQCADQLSAVDFSSIPVLCLYNSGSFLNDDEVPPEARRSIFKLIDRVPEIKHLVIESRPEFITESALAEIVRFVPSKTVEVGVGFECFDDDVRSICLNKGFNRDRFLEAAALFRRSPVKLLAYVLLKPPFLTEREGIDEAVRTIRFAFDHGADAVSLEPVSVQAFSLVHYLYEADRYRPPWIWSVFEVIRATAGLGEVRIGGFEFLPIPMVFTHNCPKCDPACSELIAEYNRGDGAALGAVSCGCEREWRREVEAVDGRPLADRIMSTLASIDLERTVERIRKNNSWDERVRPLLSLHPVEIRKP